MGKKGGKGAGAEAEEGAQDKEGFIANYKKACKSYGATADTDLIKALLDEENPITNALNISSALGPAGVRALAAAILGKAEDMKGGPYKAFNCLRFWRCNARCVVRVRRFVARAVPFIGGVVCARDRVTRGRWR